MMNRLALVMSVLLGLTPAAVADGGKAAALNADDCIAIKQVIRSQLAAFDADDGQGAFG